MLRPNYMPPAAGQGMPSSANKLSQQMQNMKLETPPLWNSGSVHNEHIGPPGIMSPQNKGQSTTVTYSGPPRATYPYNNFSPVLNSPENNNQYTNTAPSFQPTSRNTPYKTNDVNHTQSCTENGINSGLNNLKLQNQTASTQNQSNRIAQAGPHGYVPQHLNSQNQLQPHMNRPSNVQSFQSHSPAAIPRQMMNPMNIQQLPQSPMSSLSNIPPQSLMNSPSNMPPQSPINSPLNMPLQSPMNSPLNIPPHSPMNSPLNMPPLSPMNLNMPPQSPMNSSSNMPPQFPMSSPSSMPPPSPFSHTSSPSHMMNADLLSPNNLSQAPPMNYSNNLPGMPPSPPNSGGMLPNQQSIGTPQNYPYAQPNQAMPQQQQPQRIGLDHMPSNVQVREEDKKLKNGYYTTDVKGQPPPLVTTDFIVQDRGMCSPRFIRSTVYCLPNQPDMLKQTGIPFAVTVSPMSQVVEGEAAPPLALLREEGPLRCKRCKAYICSFMTFMEGGRCFQCAFCKVVTEVPQDYFSFLDGMGERTDKYHRPELCLGSYEFLATSEYCRNEQMPNPPAYIFMIEVSNATFRNGLVPLLCENMKNVLHSLKNDKAIDTSKLRVGFVTYNNVLHFYNLKKNLTQPHIMVLSDVHNAFVPLLEGFLVTLTEAEALVDCLMEHIPRLFISEPVTEIILGPVVQVGLEALKNANCSGKLLIFHSTIPNADAPGKLAHREGQKLLGTDKQKTVLNPQHEFYSKLAQECVTVGCAIDLFLFPSAFVDIATMAPLCRHTGGQIYKYTYFQSHVDGDQFLKDLKRNITTETAFDAVLRVRTSAGISPIFYYGNFYMSNNTDVELSALDGNKAITIEMAYDDKIPENETIHIQAALLYTTITGERRIRVHNLAIPTSVGMPDVFKCCEMDTIINYFAKQSVKLILESTPQQVKNNLINTGVKILSCYRKHCATNSVAGQLILAESLKLFPLYINCLIKSDAVGGGSEMTLDDKSFAMQAVNIMDVRNTAMHFYPTLIPLHEVDPDSESGPTPIRCSVEKLNDNGAYLLENGVYMFLWIGQAISSNWLQNVFGVQSTHQVDKQRTSLPELDTPLSNKICSIIEDLEKRRQWSMRLRMLIQGDKMESVFRQFLVEDRGVDGSPSYVDFLCHLHREISKNL